MMFIAIENQASAYGDKKLNTTNKLTVKRTYAQQKRHEKEKQVQYKERLQVAQQYQFNYKDDPADLKEMIFGAQNFYKKHQDKCRYGVSGSLLSMLKRVKFESENSRTKFDTLVFVGHGGSGVMTIGMGASPMELHQAPDKASPKTTNAIEQMGSENRMMNVKNTNTWLGLFRDHKECFSPDRDNNTFHVVFAGCSTGNQSTKSIKYLTHEAAKELADVLKCKVNAYGADDVIKNSHVDKILDNIETIKGMSTGQAGSYPLSTNDGNVNLVWVKRP